MNGTSGNSSNITFTDHGIYEHYRDSLKVYLSVLAIYMVVGLGLNVWLFTVILKNKELRHRLRNQLISSMLAMHIVFALTMAIDIYLLACRINWNCLVHCKLPTTSYVFDIIYSFISEWTLVIMIAVFLAHNLGFDLSTKLTPMFTTIGRYALLLFPWVLGTLLSPLIMYHHFYERTGIDNGCFYLTLAVYRMFEILNTVLPGVLCFVCLVLAEVFRRRRLARGFYSRDVDTTDGPISRKTLDNDKTLTYVVAFILSLALDIFVSVALYTDFRGGKDYITAWVIVILIRDARVILMALPWLLFQDIRQAVMFWRKPQLSSEDLNAYTVAYNKEG